ncbi:MAG: DegT/DnrJ/EryC1/StrS family aminotransferase, partial [Acidobacteriota bacterium]|nr:DegT/DnrJ/EryC1/StrS family aminotransferase [Acidobacteriota bacterium]
SVGIEPDDEVITTPFSFIASANCILFERGKPVFVDIDPATLNIDVEKIEAAITYRTRAILPVHVFGRPCRMDRICQIADKHGLAVIEDSCEAIGASFKGRRAGSFGHFGTFAFYPNKQMTTGEGGMMVTDDEQAAKLCGSWRNQGRGESREWIQHQRLGYNYRLSEINCALGLVQLERLAGMIAQRADVARQYNEALAGMDEIIRPGLAEPDAEISWFVYVVRLASEYGRSDRDRVLEFLRARGVSCSDYFTPIHLQPFYRESFGFRDGQFPITENASERTIVLPFFNKIKEDQVAYVAETLRAAVKSVRAERAVAVAAPKKEEQEILR